VCVIMSWCFGLCRVLPHDVVDEVTPICLFVSDVDLSERDYSITVDKYREMLDQAAVKPQIDVFAISYFLILTNIKPSRLHIL